MFPNGDKKLNALVRINVHGTKKFLALILRRNGRVGDEKLAEKFVL